MCWPAQCVYTHMLLPDLPAQCFVDAFFARTLNGMPDLRRQVRMAAPPTFNILSRTNSTIHVAFTYDKDIQLQGASGIIY